ncbi:cell division ATP-binding protein FtsE [Cytobacillus purgationiresistens]|uniref:Cell division transport system ATP-binding protein n=1 Tax=Cytobacillus purgationiresistens TaxID=863449 RepID=A0ABU0AUP1_9BACI|nr:ATP-binding cassette domain-containing protein [Cytobacillus purgationiresistens]MDQ0273725.1 cell division transport system ATP-binding protein [Cytobacillus purgationiresistens]
MIFIRNLNKIYNNTNVINNLDLQIEKGDFVFLHGKSGSGKSTLLKILTKEVRGWSGKITVDSQDLNKVATYNIRRKISVIYQSFELLQEKTVYENISLAGHVVGKTNKDIHNRTTLLIEKVGLKGKENLYPKNISGGEQQRVAVARALLNKPEIILADEPTGNLDTENAYHIIRLLKQLNEEGVTVLIVTHDLELVKSFPAKIIIMSEGKVKISENDHLLI